MDKPTPDEVARVDRWREDQRQKNDDEAARRFAERNARIVREIEAKLVDRTVARVEVALDNDGDVGTLVLHYRDGGKTEIGVDVYGEPANLEID